jgi:hypothetical protein
MSEPASIEEGPMKQGAFKQGAMKREAASPRPADRAIRLRRPALLRI